MGFCMTPMIDGKTPENDHRFALFDPPPNLSNLMNLMIPYDPWIFYQFSTHHLRIFSGIPYTGAMPSSKSTLTIPMLPARFYREILVGVLPD